MQSRRISFTPSAVPFAIWCLFIHQLLTQSFLFGSLVGNWDYAYWRNGSIGRCAVAAAALAAALTLLYWLSDLSRGLLRTFLIGVWLAIGSLLPLAALALAPTTLARIVETEACAGFYTAARLHTPRDLLANFMTLAPTLPMHPSTNMPGKTLLYAAIRAVTDSAAYAGVITLALSALGGLVVYGIAQRWFRDRRAALLALVLFMALPSRINFAALPNSVSPLLALLPIYLLLVYVDTHRDWLLLLIGVSVFVLFAFEPLPLILGLLGLSVVAQRWLEGLIVPRAAWKVALVPLVAFAITFVVVRQSFGFDAFQAFDYLYSDAIDFNRRAYRPYLRWLGANPIEFGVGLGVFTSAILALAAFQVARSLWVETVSGGLVEAVRRALLSRTSNIILSFFVTLAILDVWAVNRGESTRLWIFLAVVGQLAAAGHCSERLDGTTARLMVATSTFQAVLSTAMVAFSPC